MKIASTVLFIYLLCSTSASLAQTDEELRAMQQQLNAEVMEKPFSVEDEAKINEYINAAMEKDLKPEVTKAPSYWKPGYTCANIYSDGWNAYRNCRYYHRYHGSYWH